MKFVVRAGGAGTRLWPFSRQRRPKQFHAMTGQRSMIQEAVARVRPLASAEDLFVSTGEATAGLVREHLADLGPGQLIVEPALRNTGPAVGLECALLEGRDPGCVVASLGSDHYIGDPAEFRRLLKAAEAAVEEHPDFLLTIGVVPTRPETGYGYIRKGELLCAVSGRAVYRVPEFREKPDAKVAAPPAATQAVARATGNPAAWIRRRLHPSPRRRGRRGAASRPRPGKRPSSTHLPAFRPSAPAGIRPAGEGAVGHHHDHLYVSGHAAGEVGVGRTGIAFADGVAERFEGLDGGGGQPPVFVEDEVGEVLVMEPGGVYRLDDVHAVVDDVEDGLEHGGDDRRAAGGSGEEEEVAVGVLDDGGAHGREHALFGADRVAFALHQAELVRRAGFGGEVVHGVVEEEPGAVDDDLATVP